MGFAGERPDDGPACGRRGTGRSPANPKLLDGLGKPIWGVREAIVPLLSFCIPLLSPYYPFIIPLLSPYHPVAWSNLGSPFWLCKRVLLIPSMKLSVVPAALYGHSEEHSALHSMSRATPIVLFTSPSRTLEAGSSECQAPKTTSLIVDAEHHCFAWQLESIVCPCDAKACCNQAD